jgi:hypothetical protein
VFDLSDWIRTLEEALAAYRLGEPGAYRRWRVRDAEGTRDLGPNPYGCADAANILYTIGRFPEEMRQRAGFVETLRGFQDPETGLFREATHHQIHTTAHCLGALDLFEAAPRHPLRALAPLGEPAKLEEFLEGLDWRGNPWLESHRGAGLYAARVLAGDASPEWEDRYFSWLWEECDPETGMWRRGCVQPPFAWGDNRFPHLAGTFHYLFSLQHAGRPLRHPEALVDTCLELHETQEFPLGTRLGFAEIDWVYCLSRSLEQSRHRPKQAHRALESFAERYLAFLLELDLERDGRAGDLHELFGALCALAELQRVLPGRIHTERPLRLVLDRRPFI